ncbi:glutaredoxin [Elysia marginata]|uniref:Glutaredoxin n=1 Tax=Elysia marginata TaxID=1093978 RepID=A0AAV4JJP9_9GAST|nr:glutaredoxin [Elysia marginata]
MPGDFKGSIIFYSILACPNCMKAKKLLKELNVPYTEVRLDQFPEIRNEVLQRSQMLTVPQIYFNAKLVGGNEDLQRLVKDPAAWEEALNDIRENPMPKDGPIVPDACQAISEADFFNIQCEPDEYFALVTQMKTDKVVRTHGSFLRSHKNAFSGQDLLTWVQKKKELDKERGMEIGQALLDNNLANPLLNKGSSFQGGTELYLLNECDDSVVLNSGPLSECAPKSAIQLGELLRRMVLKLYSVYLSEAGKFQAKDYTSMAACAEFTTYTRIARELTRVDIKSALRDEKIAFFINIYSALFFHTYILKGPPTNMFRRYKFFNNSKYIIGGYPYSLQDIVNGVLRANRRGSGQISAPFGSKDPRLEIALEKNEPLIHFGLVRATKNCSPIKTFSPEKIFTELKLAATAYLESSEGCQIDTKNKSIKLSSIFKWYKVDFCSNDKELLAFIADYMVQGRKLADLNMLRCTGDYKLSYLTYDWSITCNT